MKVELETNSICIKAETDFESDWCAKFIGHGGNGKAFLKCGLTPADVIGIKILPPEPEGEIK